MHKPIRHARRDLIHALSAPRSLLGVSRLPHLGEEMSASRPTYLLRALVCAARARRRAAVFRQISV